MIRNLKWLHFLGFSVCIVFCVCVCARALNYTHTQRERENECRKQKSTLHTYWLGSVHARSMWMCMKVLILYWLPCTGVCAVRFLYGNDHHFRLEICCRKKRKWRKWINRKKYAKKKGKYVQFNYILHGEVFSSLLCCYSLHIQEKMMKKKKKTKYTHGETHSQVFIDQIIFLQNFTSLCVLHRFNACLSWWFFFIIIVFFFFSSFICISVGISQYRKST